jgi:hypothetical protein
MSVNCDNADHYLIDQETIIESDRFVGSWMRIKIEPNTNTTGTVNPSIDTPVGTNSSSYTPTVFTATGDFYYYAVITLDGSGCGNVTSELGQVKVVADPTVTITPTTQTICQNTTPENLEVVVTGGEGTSNYQWYKVGTPNDIAVGTNSSSFTPPTNVVGTTNYYCVVTQTGSGCQVNSAVSTVIVVPAPSISTQPLAAQTVCIDGAPTTLTVAYENGTGPANYQWYQVATSGDITVGINSPNYTPPTNVVGTNSYYCIVSFSQGGCTAATSATAVVTVNPLPTISTQPTVLQTICVGGSVPSYSVSYINGTGTPTWGIDDIIGDYLYFPGSSRATTGNYTLTTGDFSVCGWIKYSKNNVNVDDGVFGQWDGGDRHPHQSCNFSGAP